MFSIEEKAFLKQLKIEDKNTLIMAIKNIKADDDFSKEFLENILDKISSIKGTKVNI